MVTYNRGPEQVVKISKDVQPILDEIGFQYPAVKFMAEAAKMQREEDGDGVTQFTILLTSLLMKADALLEIGVHPNIIAQGFNKATMKAVDLVNQKSEYVGEKVYDQILDCVDGGRNLLSSGIRSSIIEATKIVLKDGKIDDSLLRMVKKFGGSTEETRLIKGIMIKTPEIYHGMPDSISHPSIALISGKLGLDRLSVKMKGDGPPEVELRISDPKHLIGYLSTERELTQAAIRRIKEARVNVVLCQQPIEDQVKGELVRSEIFVLEKVDEKDLVVVSKATGAKIVSSPRELKESDTGSANRLYVDRISPDEIVVIEGCNAATFLLRGSTSQAMDEVESLIKNAVKAIHIASKDCKVVPGGGAIELHTSINLKEYARQFSSREQLAIEYFAESLEEIPKILAENAGQDPINAITQLKNYHVTDSRYGIGLDGCSLMVCYESTKIKLDIYLRANDLASMMLRIDELWISKEIVKVHKQ
jgi:chaperonin GroEL (HSP60 family)